MMPGTVFRKAPISAAALACALAAFAPPAAGAAELAVIDGAAADLRDYLWKMRPVAILADSPSDPRFIEQMERLERDAAELTERDVIVLTDTDPESGSALRERLHPRGFMLVLIGKDGTIHLRKPSPRDAREISRAIDKMPMRQREIRTRRGG